MKVGYVRVSSKDQNEARQMLSMQEYGVDKIYMDKQSGKDFNRPEYQKMVSELKEGDIVILHSLDRLGRDYDGIIEEWHKITKQIKADIKVLDMPLLDTTTNENNLTGKFMADMVLQILSYAAELERRKIKQRQKEGVAIAVAQGKFKNCGRKKMEIDEELFSENFKLFEEGELSKAEFARRLNISRPKLDNLLKERMER